MLRDRAQTPPADDQFFGQLAGADRIDAQHPAPAVESPEPSPPSRRPLDPHAAHPIAPSEPQPGRRCSRRAPRPGAARQRQAAEGGGLAGRVLAAGALAIGVVAVATVVRGADPSDPSQEAAAGGRGAPNGSPAAEEPRLGVWWAKDGTTSLRERWRRDGQVTIQGRLTAGGGQPVAGAMVGVLAADGARPQEGSRTVGEVRTDREGRFEAAIALDEGAPRKRLTFTYLAHANDTVPAAQARAVLAVTPPVTLQADESRLDRGEAVRLDGRSAPLARITLAARPPASERWQPLDEVQADGEGTWQATVGAPPKASPGTWRFRAQVAPSRNDAYSGAQSDPVPVEVD